MESSTYEESKGPQFIDIEELLDMDIERQQVYNNTIDTRQLIKEDHQKNASTLGGLSHTYHASNERSHSTCTLTGQSNIEYTDEIIMFNED